MSTLLTILLSVFVSAQIDSSSISIGDQANLHVEAVANAGEEVQMPEFGDQIVYGIEIVEQTKIDTTKKKDGTITYSQDFVITSFRDSLFYIDPLIFLANGDTVLSRSMTLNVVQPFEMDTTDNITDIKPVMKPKVWWWGILRWPLLALAIIALLVGIFFLVKKFWKKKNGQKVEIDPELLRPCKEVAIEKLDRIKEEKIWQSGMHKQYFTELTDVVREYIGRRFDVSSTEKTSDETLSEMKPILANSEQQELYGRLEKMLHLADLVKFAKWSPTPDEEESVLQTAYFFVNECGDVPEKPEETAEVSKDDKKAE